MSGLVTGAIIGGLAADAIGVTMFGSTLLGGIVTGAGIGSTLMGGMSKMGGGSATLQQPTAPPASQAAQMPQAQNIRNTMMGAGQGGGSAGAAQTLLTGAGGVDPSQLAGLLGKNTLLGA